MKKLLEIRKATPADAQALLDIYKYYVTDTAVSFEWEVPSVDVFRERIKKTLEKYPYLVAVVDGRIAGYAYAGPFVGRKAYEWSVELTIYLDYNMKRQGIGRLLYEKLEDELKQMGILNLYACIGVPLKEDEYLNNDSQNFHSRMGFKKVGEFYKCGHKFGRWYNMIWMEKLIGEHKEAPQDS